MQSAPAEDTERPAAATADPPSEVGERGSPAALIAFFAAEAIALPLLLVWGRHGWFTQDDWDFLSARTIGNAGDLFRPHFQHWTTLPLLAYRAMWAVAGLHSYTAYQTLVVVAHLAAAALLLVVMRRAGVRPWIATIAAIVFVFFGTGAENILVAFQLTFTGAFAFGLAHLLLADHDGPLDRRDWFGLLAGFCGLLCSGVALTMTVVVGLAVLLRRGLRGWRVAAFHTVPLAVTYLLWLALAPKGQSAGNYRSHSVTEVLRFLLIGIEAAFARLGQIPGVGIALGLILIFGLGLLLRAHGWRPPFGRLAAPLALLAGALVFLVITGVARAGQGGLLSFAQATGPERARESRYVYVIAAMALPAIALGADALIRRRRELAIPIVVLLLVGLPGNIHQLTKSASLRQFKNAAATRNSILAVPHLPYADQLRHSQALFPLQSPRFAMEGLTFGWLIDNAGRMPDPGLMYPIQISTEVMNLYLVPVPPASVTARPAPRCTPAPRSSKRVLAQGEGFTIAGGRMSVAYIPNGGVRSLPVTLKPATYVSLVNGLPVILKPLDPGASLCD